MGTFRLVVIVGVPATLLVAIVEPDGNPSKSFEFVVVSVVGGVPPLSPKNRDGVPGSLIVYCSYGDVPLVVSVTVWKSAGAGFAAMASTRCCAISLAARRMSNMLLPYCWRSESALAARWFSAASASC